MLQRGFILSLTWQMSINKIPYNHHFAHQNVTWLIGIYGTFTNHIFRMWSKLFYIVSTLAYITPYFHADARGKVFTLSILPIIVYAVPVWYHFLHKNTRKELKVS